MDSRGRSGQPFFRRLARLARRAVAHGLPPALLGYRWVGADTLDAYYGEVRRLARGERCELIHPPDVARNALPRNVTSRDELSGERGWWGYSFRDVPERTSGATILATLSDARIVWYRDAARSNDFYPAILTSQARSLEMREVRFRPPHAVALRRVPPQRIERAAWFLERVYHNHSHWLTAHLPKLLLLRARGLLDDVLLPPPEWRTKAMEASFRLLGLDPGSFRTFDPAQPLRVATLTVLSTDRFRPELLRMVPQAFGVLEAVAPCRRVFISRALATRRRLMNEEAVWAMLEPLGFERVLMETLSFEEQVALMRETAVLVAPHGAGLTNMMFCPPGAHVVEMADLGFPNPNFYAVAAAMGHRYWLVPADASGDVHPLEKDLHARTDVLRDVLQRL